MTHYTCILIALVSGVLLLPGTSLRAEESLDATAVLKMLNAENFDTREAARKKIIEQGNAMRPVLEAELKKKDLDPDYVHQIKVVLGEMRSMDICNAFDAPPRTDMELKNVSVADALAQIGKRFSRRVIASGDAKDLLVTLTIKQATFFEAVDAIRHAAKLNYDIKDMKQQIQNRAKQLQTPGMIADDIHPVICARNPVPSAVSGPFLIIIDQGFSTVHQAFDFSLGGKPSTGKPIRRVTLNGTLFADPMLQFSSIGLLAIKVTTVKPENEFNGEGKLLGHWSDKMRTGESEAYSFETGFNGPQDLPEAMNWKFTVEVEVPVNLAEVNLAIIPEIIGKAQNIRGGSIMIEKIAFGTTWKTNYGLVGDIIQLIPSQVIHRWNQLKENSRMPGNLKYVPSLHFVDAKGTKMDFNSGNNAGKVNAFHGVAETNSEPKAIVIRNYSRCEKRSFEIELRQVPVP